MLTAAALATYILAIAQPVAAECERDRLARECAARPTSPACKTIVVESTMPRPSQTWANAWATMTIADPLLRGEPRYEAIHGLVWAFGESLYNDRAGGAADGGESGCSMGVWASFHGVTVKQLQDDPALCVAIARKVMRWSFSRNADHPMAQYAGSAFDARSIAVADARTALVKRLAAKLPPLKGDGPS